MDVENFINQQLGILRWTHCDSMLSRLESRQKDEYKYILPFGDAETVVDSPIFACKFSELHGYQHLLALANEEGKVAIYDTTGKTERYGKNIHHNAIFDVAWQPESPRIITASGDNTAVLLDIAEADLRISRLFYGHSRSVKTVAFCGKNDPYVFSTGSRDGTIILWDIRAERSNACEFISYPDTTIVNSHLRKPKKLPNTSNRPNTKRVPIPPLGNYPGSFVQSRNQTVSTISGSDSVTCIAFSDPNSLVSCGAGDGDIKVWDMRKTYTISNSTPTPKRIIEYCGSKVRSGYTNLLVDTTRNRLYASCLDNVVYCHNLAALDDPRHNNVIKYTGYYNSTFYVKSALSPCGRYLISGSSDQNAYIWNIEDAIEEPILRLRGHMAEVTCVAWMDNLSAATDNPLTVVTCSDDMHHRIWRLGLGDGDELIDDGRRETRAPYEQGENDIMCFAELLPYKKPLHSGKRFRVTSEPVTMNLSNKRHKALENSDSRKRPLDDCLLNDTKRFAGDTDARRLYSALIESCFGDGPVDIIAKLASPPRHANKRKYNSEYEIGVFLPFSPTANLPNFVVDGLAPHRSYSPQKRKDADWLTKLRTQKQLVEKINAQGLATTANEDLNFDIVVPQRNGNEACALTPKKPRVDYLVKKSRRRSSCSSPKTSLYNYFKVTNNGQLSPKTSTQTSQAKVTNENPSQ